MNGAINAFRMYCRSILAVLIITASIVPEIACGATGNLSVGVSKIDITPSLDPKTSEKYPIRETYGRFYIRVLVLEVDDYRIGVISCDIIKWEYQRIIDIARDRFNISHLLICSSHCHRNLHARDDGTPEYVRYRPPDVYVQFVEQSMIDGLEKALQNMFPARIAAGYGKELPALGYNRLTGRPLGKKALWENYDHIPYGPVDPEIGVIRIDDASGNPRVILMTYACHPVANRGGVKSADYPGVATKKVEEAFGNQTICLFVQGAGGDINPMFMTPKNKPNAKQGVDYGPMELMGQLLAKEVIRTAKELTPRQRQESSITAIADSLHFTGWYEKDRHYNVHFTTVLINDEIAVASVNGEPFLQHKFFWDERADVSYPLFFGYTYSSGGIWPGYIPDIRSSAYGGYGADGEGSDGTGLIQVGAGETIMNKQLENLYRLRGMIIDKPHPE